jgi:hypothetical protein
MAVVQSKGYIIGNVTHVIAYDGKQSVSASLYRRESATFENVRWLLQTSAKSIQPGDVICLLKGCSKPTVIRPRSDCFAIIMVAASPMKNKRAKPFLPLQVSLSLFRS